MSMHRPPPRMRHHRLGALVAALGLLATVVALSVPLASHAAGRETATSCGNRSQERASTSYVPALRTYDDAIGDSANAPDFCASELVTNDSRVIEMGIHAHNRSGFVAGDSYTVFLDTDRNAATGGGGVGAEYQIVFAGSTGELEQWNGTVFDPSTAVSIPVLWVPGYGPLLVYLRSQIGNAAGFNFVLVSANGADSDRAPDTGSWSYTVQPFSLKVRSLSVGVARAGKAFTARAVVLRSDFDDPLDEGKITCAAKLAGHGLAGKGKFSRGGVLCTWRMPAAAHGKRLTGTVSVAFQGARAARAFSARVR